MTAELVCRTSDPQWLAERRRGVTATDIPAIMGLSPWDSAYSVWWKKVGESPDPADTLRLRLGRALESHIVELWEENSGDIGAHGAREAGLYRHHGRPWQLATPDRLAWMRQPVECKSWGTTEGWGDDGSDIIPVTVRAQLLWQMDVLGAAAGHVGVVFLPSGEFRRYEISHAISAHLADSDDTCQACADQSMMRIAGKGFWDSVVNLEPPSPDGSAATLAALKARFGNPDKQVTAELDPDLVMKWRTFRAAEKDYEAARRQCEAEMRELAGDAGVYTVGGEPVIRRERFTAHVKAHDRSTDRLMPIKPRKEASTDELCSDDPAVGRVGCDHGRGPDGHGCDCGT